MQKNNRNTVIAASFIALAAVGIISFNVMAGENDTVQGAGQGYGRGMNRNLSAEEKTQFNTDRATHRAEMGAKRQAMIDAMNQGYDAWVAKVKEVSGEDAIILTKINAGNFAQFVTAHQNMETAHAELAKLGVNPGDCGMGGGMGHGMGMGRGMGKGLSNNQ